MGNVSQHVLKLSLKLNAMSVNESCFLGCRHVRRSKRCGTSTRSCLADVCDIGRESLFGSIKSPLLHFLPCLYLQPGLVFVHAFTTPELQRMHITLTLLREGVRSPGHPTRLDVWDFAASTLLRERAHWRAQLRRSTFEIYQKSGEERRGRL